ncbi:MULTISPECIES: molybdopterin-synthase adenylyltransferase MoeB [unclassified Brevundimonas]|uniref:HesA/MoeB/ThiF family protein n=1 Tax=unclassified Brevundimonas TaxID=2622653 RepID=UPI000CFD02CF|nr:MULTISPECIES: molybdopterin-synthase adenylyltransferase MoeB [unclassified Brevundimonas]PRA34853.1 molybdopterin biosynthesis protein MoeB [Brevundimonas sp. MYb27]PQZ83419.1 molybdopterin biosynthesis protein MoeB [Brevundimonas sp. MYb31]PRB14305.1 molybdopterin biosynthesis protein MoeB [Brevundimonas sp. MYb52]PRB35448.1 molybdopterin biosynthesis protein MoeB [Brevundimonas sp. MYb46]PRB54635.1 molybdopterin biosynthesis protein MoeB [Brevundimonas sp. MYb33]
MTQPPLPAPVRFSDEEVDRYARQLVLSEIGGPGQQALKRARVLIVGMGGVGAPAALYLAAAGVGTLGLIDHDAVALSNLQRQIIFTTADAERPKVEAGAEHLAALNPHVAIEAFAERLTPDNARNIVERFDVVLDGTDDFDTRFAVNAACVATGTPLVSGALGRWNGQVGVFTGKPCYQCLVPETPPDAETCARVGVVGALAGVIGAMAALEAIKLITGAGQPLAGRLMLYDGLAGTSRVAKIAADPSCPVCGG